MALDINILRIGEYHKELVAYWSLTYDHHRAVVSVAGRIHGPAIEGTVKLCCRENPKYSNFRMGDCVSAWFSWWKSKLCMLCFGFAWYYHHHYHQSRVAGEGHRVVPRRWLGPFYGAIAFPLSRVVVVVVVVVVVDIDAQAACDNSDTWWMAM